MKNDRTITLRIDQLRLEANIGILDHELQGKQPLVMTIEVDLDQRLVKPAEDHVEHVFDYRKLRAIALSQANAGHVNMIETLANRICDVILADESVARVSLTITKPAAFVDANGATVLLIRTRVDET